VTPIQRGIAVLALLAIIGTAARAPYRYRATWSAVGYERDGTTHAPLWSPPAPGYQPQWLLAPESKTVTEVHLKAGMLGLWWGAIALAAVVAMVLVAPRRRPR